MARQAIFQVIPGFNTVTATITRNPIGPTGSMVVGQYQEGIMTINTELTLGMTDITIPFPANGVQMMRKSIIQRVGQTVQVVPLVTHLAIFHRVAGITCLIGIHR